MKIYLMNKKKKELYTLVYNKFINSTFPIGLCYVIKNHLHKIGVDSYHIDLLVADFEKRKPTIWSKFWWNRHFIGNNYNYWWDITEKGWEQRAKFLKHIISKL